MKKVNVFLPFALSFLLALSGCGQTTQTSSSRASSSNQTSKTSSTTSSTSKTNSSSTGGSSSPASSTSLAPVMPVTITSPEANGTLSIVDPLVKQYWDLTLNPDATAASPDDSLTFLTSNATVNHDRQSSKIIFTATKADTYVVRVSTSEAFTTYFERKVVGDSGSYSANLLTLYPKTKYYAKVMGSDGLAASSVVSFTTEDAPRFLNAVGASPYNFRDSGGYTIGGGKRIRYGMLYRGREIDTMEKYGRQVMGEYLGINSEVDLRNPGGDTGYQTANMIDIHHPYYSCPISGYEHNIGDAYWESGIKALFEAVSNKDNYPMYFHCTHGEDRTGVAAFLINGLCGVSWSDLTRDYELSSFAVNKALRTNSSDYGSWKAFHEAIVAKGASGDELKTCIEKYLLSIGITQSEIDNVRTILVEDESAAIPNTDYYVKASLKKPCHVAVTGGTSEVAWAEEGDNVTLSAPVPLSGQTFKGWNDGTALVSTENPYTFKITANCAYTAVYEDDASVKEAEKNDLFYTSSLSAMSHVGVSYQAVDDPTANSASKRAFHFTAPSTIKDWPNITLKLATPIVVKSGIFSFAVKHSVGTVDWMSMRFFDSTMSKLGNELGAEPETDGAWKNVSFTAPTNCTISYLCFTGNTNDDTGGKGFEFYLDNLAFQATESVAESGTAGEKGYTATNLENLPLDSGLSKSTISYDYSTAASTDSVCSLKSVMDATSRTANWEGHVGLNLADGVTNKQISALPNLLAGTLSGSFKFSDDITNPVVKVATAFETVWAQTDYVSMTLGDADAAGWRKATLDVSALGDLYKGTSSDFNGKAVRFIFAFGELAQTGTVWMDQLSFEQGDVKAVAKEHIVQTGTVETTGYTATNLENMIRDDGMSKSTLSYDRTEVSDAEKSYYSLKSVMDATSRTANWEGHVTLNVADALKNGQVSGLFNSKAGTLSGYFKFSSDIATPVVQVAAAFDKDWAETSYVSMTLGDADAAGWRKGTLDVSALAHLYTGTSADWKGDLVRLIFAFGDLTQTGTVWMDQLSFEQGDISTFVK